MKVKLTKEMQAIILTVKDYASFLRRYHYGVLENYSFDWWQETENFYKTLPLPKELNTL